MKKNKKLKMDLNSAYEAAMDITMKSIAYKNLKKVLESGYVTSYPSYLSDRELISKIFYYSGRSLQDRNYESVEDATTLHFLIMEYANRYGEDE